MKTVRASMESGMFSLIMKIDESRHLPSSIFLGGLDLLVLSGEVHYAEVAETSILTPGTWGYLPANTRTTSIRATQEAEILVNCFNSIAFLNEDNSISSILTAMDVNQLAKEQGVTMVPNSLAECALERPEPFEGVEAPLAIAQRDAKDLVEGDSIENSATYSHPHFIDTRQVPWIINPDLPDIGLKIVKVP